MTTTTTTTTTKDTPGASQAAAVPSPLLSASNAPDTQTVQQWRTELEAFCTRTRQELKSLSQSLTAAQQKAVQQTKLDVQPCDLPATMPNHNENSTAPPRAIEMHIGTPTVPASNLSVSNDDRDPMERLNAIKLRLSKQIENAS